MQIRPVKGSIAVDCIEQGNPCQAITEITCTLELRSNDDLPRRVNEPPQSANLNRREPLLETSDTVELVWNSKPSSFVNKAPLPVVLDWGKATEKVAFALKLGRNHNFASSIDETPISGTIDLEEWTSSWALDRDNLD